MIGPWEGGPGHGPAAPLILTLDLPPTLAEPLAAARLALDPARAARTPLHCSLFRHLPGPSAEQLMRDLRAIAADTPAPRVAPGPPRFASGHLLVPLRAPDADALRARLADCWHGLLVPPDAAPPRLHVTLARHRPPPGTLASLARLAVLPRARAPSLTLWRHGPAWARLVTLRLAQ